ncbi:hypothetical protein SUGI_0794010 [Cryptomeria japonica]|nr:hypothetical protein SUGI_0794010 [Cryptomeria japonica]
MRIEQEWAELFLANKDVKSDLCENLVENDLFKDVKEDVASNNPLENEVTNEEEGAQGKVVLMDDILIDKEIVEDTCFVTNSLLQDGKQEFLGCFSNIDVKAEEEKFTKKQCLLEGLNKEEHDVAIEGDKEQVFAAVSRDEGSVYDSHCIKRLVVNNSNSPLAKNPRIKALKLYCKEAGEVPWLFHFLERPHLNMKVKTTAILADITMLHGTSFLLCDEKTPMEACKLVEVIMGILTFCKLTIAENAMKVLLSLTEASDASDLTGLILDNDNNLQTIKGFIKMAQPPLQHQAIQLGFCMCGKNPSTISFVEHDDECLKVLAIWRN